MKASPSIVSRIRSSVRCCPLECRAVEPRSLLGRLVLLAQLLPRLSDRTQLPESDGQHDAEGENHLDETEILLAGGLILHSVRPVRAVRTCRAHRAADVRSRRAETGERTLAPARGRFPRRGTRRRRAAGRYNHVSIAARRPPRVRGAPASATSKRGRAA